MPPEARVLTVATVLAVAAVLAVETEDTLAAEDVTTDDPDRDDATLGGLVEHQCLW